MNLRKYNLENTDTKNDFLNLKYNNEKSSIGTGSDTLSLTSKTDLLNSKLIENLCRPSIHAANRILKLNCLLAESRINSEQIRNHEENHVENLTKYFRELYSFPPIVFPKTKKKTLPKITDQMLRIIVSSVSGKHPDHILVENFNLSVRVADLISLQHRNWLTDNIINVYLELIASRNNQSSFYPKIQVLSTFFYPKLCNSGYNGIKRWTKKRPIFDCEIVFVPIHLGNHWCLVKIDFVHQEVLYYDSLKGTNSKCLDVMKIFLIEDSKDKQNKCLDISNWKFSQVYDSPSQHNGYDCGVFLSQTAEYLSRRSKLDFCQDQMTYFREKMSYEILTKQLL